MKIGRAVKTGHRIKKKGQSKKEVTKW